MTHPLKEWMSENKVSAAEMSRRLACSKPSVHRIIKGDQRPSVDLAFRIRDVTGGAISFEHLFDSFKGGDNGADPTN